MLCAQTVDESYEDSIHMDVNDKAPLNRGLKSIRVKSFLSHRVVFKIYCGTDCFYLYPHQS